MQTDSHNLLQRHLIEKRMMLVQLNAIHAMTGEDLLERIKTIIAILAEGIEKELSSESTVTVTATATATDTALAILRKKAVEEAMKLINKPAYDSSREAPCIGAMQHWRIPKKPFHQTEWRKVPVGSVIVRKGKTAMFVIEAVNPERRSGPDYDKHWIRVDGEWISAIDLFVDYEDIDGYQLGIPIGPAEPVPFGI